MTNNIFWEGFQDFSFWWVSGSSDKFLNLKKKPNKKQKPVGHILRSYILSLVLMINYHINSLLLSCSSWTWLFIFWPPKKSRVVRNMGNNSLSIVHHIAVIPDFATNHKLLRQILWRTMTEDEQLCICAVLHSLLSLDGALKPYIFVANYYRVSGQSVDQHNFHNFTAKCK